MPDIKTRDIEKGTVKAIDKSTVAAERMKDAYIRTKDKAEHSFYSAESSPGEYAADRISGGADSAAREAVRQFDKQGRNGVKTTREHFERQISDIPKKQNRQRAAKGIRRSADTAKQSVKTVERNGKTIKQTAKSTGKATMKTAKGTVKTAQKTVKTAERTARTTIKTAQQTAKAAQKTAHATAKSARAAAHAVRAAAKTAAVTAKATVKAIALTVKAIVAGTKALIAAIVAGGWIVILIIIIICMIGLLIGSCFGIFFSGETSGSGITMQNVIREINNDYQTQINTTKANISYDVLELSGSHIVWPEVLSVYAVKTNSGTDNAQEVATIDDSKKAILKDIFWQMNKITSWTETKTEEVITETDDGHGNIVETVTIENRTYLYITVTHKTAEEMADQYGFNEDQREQLNELLAEENRSIWSSLLSEIDTDSD